MCILHKWSMWGEPQDTYNAEAMQARACIKCAKVVTREVSTPQISGSQAGAINKSLDSIADLEVI